MLARAVTSLILITFVCGEVNASLVINRYEDECVLDAKLVTEIESYKNVTQKIFYEVFSRGLGQKFYSEFTKFIDKFGPRLAGSERLENAIDYMIQLTKDYGLNDVKTEDVQVPHWVRVHESAFMVAPRYQEIAILGLGSSVSTPSNGLVAKAIVVKSFAELDALDNKQVEGKIVVYDVPFVGYGETVQYRVAGASKAAKKGGVAALVRSITPFSMYTPHTGAQFYEDNITQIPTAAITHEDADLLSRLQSQHETIIINITMLNTIDYKTSRNTIIDLKGYKYPEKQVIVSGHIDSWDVGQGAMDDGAGMMISWFAPVLLNRMNLKPKRTVRAILWTGEEPGLVGAQAYLKRHENDLLNINFIMESDEGTFQPLGLTVAGSKQANCIIKEVLKNLSPIDKFQESDSPGSDITIFIQKGVPGASLLNKNERYMWFHHTEADTLNVLNMTDVINCASFWAAVSYIIADISVDIPRL